MPPTPLMAPAPLSELSGEPRVVNASALRLLASRQRSNEGESESVHVVIPPSGVTAPTGSGPLQSEAVAGVRHNQGPTAWLDGATWQCSDIENRPHPNGGGRGRPTTVPAGSLGRGRGHPPGGSGVSATCGLSPLNSCCAPSTSAKTARSSLALASISPRTLRWTRSGPGPIVEHGCSDPGGVRTRARARARERA